MAVDNGSVLIGAPYQVTTGAIQTAAVGTTAPTDAETALTTGWTDSGYVSQDGLNLSMSRSTTNVLDWSLSNVRTIVTEFTGTVGFSYIQTSEAEAKQIFGEDNVTMTTGLMKISVGTELPDRKSWVFNMKDGERRIRIYLPDAQVTNVDAVTFAAGSVITWPVTVSAYPDSTGKSIYIFADGYSG